MNTVYFSKELTLAEGKSLYRKLLLANHPDVGGSDEVCGNIIKEFESFCKYKMQYAFNEADEKTGDADVNVFAEMLAKVIDFNCRIEIIGFWIYAFESFEYKDQLKELGFFFSSKHKAWVYNGGAKRKGYTKYSLNTIKDIYGCTSIRTKEDQKKLA